MNVGRKLFEEEIFLFGGGRIWDDKRSAWGEEKELFD